MKSNSYKCHLIVSSNDVVEIQIGNSVIENSNHGKLLGVKIGNIFNFDGHVKIVYEKKEAVNKPTCWDNTIYEPRKKIILSSFFNVRFNYCALI